MLVCICVEFAEICVWVCVNVGGVVDVVECGLFFECGWIVSLCSGCVVCCAFCLICDA